MIDSRSKKKSKDAQAERILQSLSHKTRSCLVPNSKKIKKKKKLSLDESFKLTYKTADNIRKHVSWIMPKSRLKPKEKFILAQDNNHQNTINSEQSISNANEVVNYAAIFELAYEDLKSESINNKPSKVTPKNGYSKKIEDKKVDIRANDTYTGIEYDPVDNYFYLVSDHDNSSKKQLFKNQAISNLKDSCCIVLNPQKLHAIKKKFELDSFLC